MTTDHPATEQQAIEQHASDTQAAGQPYGYFRIDFAQATASGWAAHAEYVELVHDGRTLMTITPQGTDTTLQRAVPEAVPFELDLPRRYSALAFVAEKVRLVAVAGRRRTILSPTDGFRVVCADKARQELENKAAARGGSGGTDHPQRVLHPRPEDFSPVHLPVGYSADPAVLGHDGVMFLTGGSNSLTEQYRMAREDVRELSAQWVELLRRRAERCAELGITYVQTILPEKLSILRDLAPVPVNGPTPLLREVSAALRSEPWWVNVRPALEQMKPKRSGFFATDTHLSPQGTQKVAAGLFAAVEPRLRGVVERVPMSTTQARRGDLSKYFGTLPFYEQVMVADDRDFQPYAEAARRTARGEIGSGRHRGLWFDFRNSTAASPKSAMAFGSSSFGPGEDSEHLGWWAKHLFAEFRMRWQAEFDWEEIERVRPDVVIGQTIERFMPQIPEQ